MKPFLDPDKPDRQFWLSVLYRRLEADRWRVYRRCSNHRHGKTQVTGRCRDQGLADQCLHVSGRCDARGKYRPTTLEKKPFIWPKRNWQRSERRGPPYGGRVVRVNSE